MLPHQSDCSRPKTHRLALALDILLRSETEHEFVTRLAADAHSPVRWRARDHLGDLL
jgi:hypothetical protein